MPLVVIGEPVTVRPVGVVIATLVTVPLGKPRVEVLVQRVEVPVLMRIWPLVPALAVVSRRMPVTVRFVALTFVDVAFVKTAVLAAAPPMAVPSSVPPLISIVVTVPRLAQVAPEAVGEPPMVGEVRVLLVRVSLPAKVARVPVVGRVTFVAPVVVKVRLCAPLRMNGLPAILRFVTPRFVEVAEVKLAFKAVSWVPLKVRLAESVKRPPVVAYGIRVLVRPVIARFEVVAFVRVVLMYVLEVAKTFVEVAFVNTPVLGVVAPMVTPLMVPPVKVKLLST